MAGHSFCAVDQTKATRDSELDPTAAAHWSRSQGRCEHGQHCDQASVESRFEAFHASGLTQLIGREEELELLLRRWSKAKIGEGQVVLLSGEAGIGKSRLTAALLERLASEPQRACAIFALRSTRTARSIRSLAKWSVPPDWRMTTLRKRSSTSSMPCSRRLQPHPGRGHFCRDAFAAE